MNKNEAEALFASIFQRWSTGNIDNFERDYSEEMTATFDDQELSLEDLKQRITFFYEQYEFLESKIEDFIYAEGNLAVRLYVKFRRRSDEEIIDDNFHWFYEIRNKQVIKFWTITNYFFGFPSSKSY